MFGLNKRSKSDLEKQIEIEGIDSILKKLTEIALKKIATKKIAYQFILEEIEGASRGNNISKEFAEKSGISPEQYRGAMSNSRVEVDGPNSAQQFLNTIGEHLSGNEALRVNIRIGIVKNIMKHFFFGNYKPHIASLISGLKLDGDNVNIIAIVSNDNKIIYFNSFPNNVFTKDKGDREILEGSVVNIVFEDQAEFNRIELFVAFDELESYTMFTDKQEMVERLNYIAKSFRNYCLIKIPNLFISENNYSTQYKYFFITTRSNNAYCMINHLGTDGYLIQENTIIRGDADLVESIFEIF